MGKFKIITVSGPSGAGKDVAINELYTRLELQCPGKVSKSRYFTTRTQMRPGEKRDGYFLSPQEFEARKQIGEIVFSGEADNYRVGISPDEFFKNEVVIVNIAPQFVEEAKKIILQHDGECFSIFIWADKEERVQREQLREAWLFSEIPRHHIEHDIVKETPETVRGMDLVIENKEGRLKETVDGIMAKVESFLGS